jgi:hypothetical protein
MLVLFGLNATQSSLVIRLFEVVGGGRLLTITINDVRILNRDIRAPVGVPAIRVLRWVCTVTSSCNVDVIKNNIAGISDEMIIFWRITQYQIAQYRVLEAVNAEEDRAKSVDVLGI